MTTLAAVAGVAVVLTTMRHSGARMLVVIVILCVYVGIAVLTGGGRPDDELPDEDRR